MKLNKSQLHVLYTALGIAVDHQSALSKVYAGMEGYLRKRNTAVNNSLRFSNMREQIGRVLRGEVTA